MAYAINIVVQGRKSELEINDALPQKIQGIAEWYGQRASVLKQLLKKIERDGKININDQDIWHSIRELDFPQVQSSISKNYSQQYYEAAKRNDLKAIKAIMALAIKHLESLARAFAKLKRPIASVCVELYGLNTLLDAV